jgi:cyclic beta-1,2-glucan synthetase
LDVAAAELAERHATRPGAPKPLEALSRIRHLPGWLERHRTSFAQVRAVGAKAAEWILDNEYLVARTARQIAEDLPRGFYARLPALDGEGAGRPRIWSVACSLVVTSRLQISRQTLTRFVDAYQQSTPLTVAELWALPTCLRLACIEVLVAALARLDPTLRPPFRPDRALDVDVDDTECIGRAISNLRVIASISWKDVFGALSRVESTLGDDPAGVYGGMDFETRDRYRRAVEAIARGGPRSELDVARQAVDHAREAGRASARRAHVGYWLIDEGRVEFERVVGSRPPMRRRVARWVRRRAARLYLLSLVAATTLVMALPAAYLRAVDAGPWMLALGLLLTLLPASALAITVVQWLSTRLVAPRALPKLDFEAGIPDARRTAVVIPTLVGSPEDVTRQLHRLEMHYLANPTPDPQFVLLSDFQDAPTERLPSDDAIVRALVDGVRQLNAKHARPAFHVLHRPRRFNPSEGVWMGWERKRGKLEQFNGWLLGSTAPWFIAHAGETDRLRGTRYVVTLDADTMLPQGTLARLIGTLAHPLNEPEFDVGTGRVRTGYTVIQPRIEVAPEAGSRSLFARWFTGDTAIDIYSRAVSDVYQDLFGAGIFVGKGAYDVAAFARSVEDRVPENALVSHDLFEGVHGRVALATDIVLYEGFPRHYLEFSRRQHRWIRGDWQLLPWFGRTVPGAGGRRFRNRLSWLDRWKLADNLRRSLLSPALIALLVAGWVVLPGHPAVWTMLGLLAPAGHLFTDLVTGFARGRRRRALSGAWVQFTDHVGRWALLLLFLPHDARVAIDAIGRTLVRVFVTRRRLLEWTTAASTAEHFKGLWARALLWQAMWAGPALALASLAAILALRPSALWAASPLLAMWVVAPEIAFRLGRARPLTRDETLTPEARIWLRRLARRTWRYFETFAGPDNHWLPPDNYQEEPRGEVAHRTSPTNVGMLMLSSLAACDLGHVDPIEFRSRIKNTLDSLDQLERYRGHLFNWYDTRTLEPLIPRYVSTVDSGNLALSLIALGAGCRDIARRPMMRSAQWDGLLDALALLAEAVEGLSPGADVRSAILAPIRQAEKRVHATRGAPATWAAALAELGDRPAGDLEHRLVSHLGDGERGTTDLHRLRDVRTWRERAAHHVRAMRRQMDDLCPWLPLLDEAPAARRVLADELRSVVPATLGLADVPDRVARARDLIGRAPGGDEDSTSWTTAVLAALDQGERAAAALHADLTRLSARADEMAWAMDFRPLYDAESRLFRIGYDASSDRLDSHTYDLLASEARLASLFAIAKGDAPVEHWFHLGRPVTLVRRRRCLISWGGSMFEYLMPSLLMRSEPGTLLAESERAAIAAQRRHSHRLGIPWGMSESGFGATDARLTYQYRSFGVPALGLRRGIAADTVVAPYASLLAVAIAPESAVENGRRLEALGLLGEYGFYEAADYTVERAHGREFVFVRSYMAHHQGMILAAIDNALMGRVLVRRVASDPRMHAVSLLLHERVPTEIEPEAVSADTRVGNTEPPAPMPNAAPWSPRRQGVFPQLHLLGNGRLASWVSDSGAGALRWKDWSLTRWTPDTVLDDTGVWIYLRDEAQGRVWSATRQPVGGHADAVGVVYSPNLIEFHRREEGIAVRLEIAVSPADDLEIRALTIVNDQDRPRRLSVTTAGEVVLAPAAEHDRHPAFSRLFVRSEHIPHVNGVVFSRRSRDPQVHPPAMMHWFVSDDPAARWAGAEADRGVFVGRGRDWRNPAAAMRPTGESMGFTLDPLMAVRAWVDLAPGATVRMAFLTAAAGARDSAVALAERYQTMSAIDWVLADAQAEGAHELARVGLDSEALARAQTLASLLVYPHRARGRPGRELHDNRLGQPGLWGLGISGDLPILAVRQGAPDDIALIEELVRAQALWRRRRLACDLVVLSEHASGYESDVVDRLRSVLEAVGVRDWLGASGGVHVVRADQVGPDVVRLVEAAAHMVLDTRRGTLDAQLAGVHDERPAIPRFVPTSPPVPEPAGTEPAGNGSASPADRRFDNGLGAFSAGGREYVIRLPPGVRTPAPWVNVLANETFGALVSEAGLGYTWSANASEHRLTPWSNDPVRDPQGEAVYLRDEETAAVWSPTPQPAGTDATFDVRHGAGWTSWRSSGHGLEQELRVLVPPDDPVKIVRLRLRDLAGRPRRLTATCFVEWVLGGVRGRSGQLVAPEYEPNVPAIVARNPWVSEFAERVAFLTSSGDVHGFTLDRSEFLGREGSLRRPAALERWGLTDNLSTRDEPCAALQVHLDLEAHGDGEVVFVLGDGTDREHALALASRYRRPGAAEAAGDRLERFWEERLSVVQIETPDDAMNVMLNRWLLYQALASRMLGRTGFYQSSGAIGFRDQLQDGLACALVEPQRLRAHLLDCARHQFEEGDVLHWWHPPAGRGVRTRCSDDLLWLPYAVAHYVEATDDGTVLDESVPFLRGRLLQDAEQDLYGAFETGATATIFEHCERALERGVTRGPHDLPRIGAGDWNDGMNRVGWKGEGESVWLGWFACATMRRFAGLCRRRRDDERARRWDERAAELTRALEAHGWDGDWYRRAYDDHGLPWGSRTNAECRIDSIAQSWSVLSGAGDPVRATRAIDSALEHLVDADNRLVRLLTPPFGDGARDPGYIRAYPPGIRENGGQYTHAAVWLGWALADLGRGDEAARLFDLLNPIRRTLSADAAAHYRVEPYALAADVGGAPPHIGRGGWTWYTGSAAWLWRFGVERLVGLQPAAGGVRIAPCFPRDWPAVHATIRTAGGVLDITIDNPDRLATGHVELRLDDRPLEGDIVPLPTDGRTHVVRARLREAGQVASPSVGGKPEESR